MPDSHEMKSGAVTFLDVLGWKGIWLRHAAEKVVGLLESLVRLAQDTADHQRGKGEASETRVLSISDTIVLLTEGPVSEVTPIHGLICKKLLPESARLGIPLRGATSFGEFSASGGTIVIGPAVDEAASWHENLDWIGVVLAPGAEFNHNPVTPWVQYPKAPVKGLGPRKLWCVDWGEEWADDEIRKIFAQACPLPPEVAVKYINTLDFLRARIEDRAKTAGASAE